MILSVDELKTYIKTTEQDAILEAKLRSIESLVRNYTNNNFQQRNIRFKCPAMQQKLFLSTDMLRVGDTVQISDSMYCDGVYTIISIIDGYIELNQTLFDESEVLVTMVKYPDDVKMGVVNMMKWELENRDKVGIQSETISRHSVTYFNMDGDNSTMGFPKALLGFLNVYKRARF